MEEPLPAGGSCLLGSLNLAEFVKNNEFDYESFTSAVEIAVIGLNDVLDEGLELHPLQIQRDVVKDYRQIGLGIMGLADMLIKLGIEYGSEESLMLCDKIGDTLARSALLQSSYLAQKYGTFGECDKLTLCESEYFQNHYVPAVEYDGLRNSQILTIAPTGSISTMLNVSGGMEPIYDLSYTRKTESLHGEDKYYKIYTPIVKKYMEDHNLSDESELPSYFVTSKTIKPINRIKMQSVWQNHIDASISSTINLPESATIKDIYDIYMRAYTHNLKGITVFRDNCSRTGILTTDSTSKQDEKYRFNHIIPPSKEDLGETIGYNDKKKVACGSLYLTVAKDPSTQEIVEVYINKSKSGVCEAMSQGVSRLVSTCLRSGVSVEYLCDQLIGIKCQACITARKDGKNVELSCPHAIGSYILEKHNQGIVINDIKVNDFPNNLTKNIIVSEHICPECGNDLAFVGGCVSCQCGYSKCS